MKLMKTLTQNKIEKAYEKKRKLEMAKAEKIATPLKTKLAKDPDWSLVTGTKKCETNEDYIRYRRAKNRIIKQAIRTLLPDFKVNVRYGHGTGYHWVEIDLNIPDSEYKKLPEEKLQVLQRIKNVLIALGIRFATYYTDYGFNDSYVPCLNITMNNRGI